MINPNTSLPSSDVLSGEEASASSPARSLQSFAAWIEDRLHRLQSESDRTLAAMQAAIGEPGNNIVELHKQHETLHRRWCEIREARHLLICYMSGDEA